VVEAFAIACNPGRTTPLVVSEVEAVYTAAASVVAQAIAKAAADCSSNGNAFGCAQAQAQANAWASATAEAYARAYAEAINKCIICKNSAQQASASAEVVATSFIELVADVYARAEVQVCVAGNDNASAEAFSKCFASAYAKLGASAVAKAFVKEGCSSANTNTFVDAATAINYGTIESCAQTTSVTPEAPGISGAAADTAGNNADAVRPSPLRKLPFTKMCLLLYRWASCRAVRTQLLLFIPVSCLPLLN
jgi:hypothetical protein